MYTNLSTTEAISLLVSDEYANWSWSGAEALVKHLEDLEDSLDEPIQFDRIAFRCEYSEYSSALEAAEQYDFIYNDDNDEEGEKEAAALKYLEDRTTVIQFEGGVIFHQF